jgi:hypothetical protein
MPACADRQDSTPNPKNVVDKYFEINKLSLSINEITRCAKGEGHPSLGLDEVEAHRSFSVPLTILRTIVYSMVYHIHHHSFIHSFRRLLIILLSSSQALLCSAG